MRTWSIAGIATTAAMVAAAGSAASQAPPKPVPVPEEVSCARCRITVTNATTLKAKPGVDGLVTVPLAINLDSRGRFWVSQEDQVPLLFDASGRFFGPVGVKGDSIGQYRGVYAAIPIAGDSVVLFDARLERATVLGPNLKPARIITVKEDVGSGAVISWPASAILVRVGWHDLTAPPLFSGTFAGISVDTIGPAFGPDRDGIDDKWPNFQKLTTPRNGLVWAADVGRYRLSQWTADGKLVRSLDRKASWFPPVSPFDLLGDDKSGPAYAIHAIAEDANGLLWVFIDGPRPEWREGWPKGPPGVKTFAGSQYARERLLRTKVEVIDPATGRVVARREIDGWVNAAFSDRRAAAYSVDAQGNPRITILQLGLTGMPAK